MWGTNNSKMDTRAGQEPTGADCDTFLVHLEQVQKSMRNRIAAGGVPKSAPRTVDNSYRLSVADDILVVAWREGTVAREYCNSVYAQSKTNTSP